MKAKSARQGWGAVSARGVAIIAAVIGVAGVLAGHLLAAGVDLVTRPALSTPWGEVAPSAPLPPWVEGGP